MRADLRAALVIAARILRQRIRDRSALLFAVVTPLGLAVAFSVLIPNDFSTFTTHLLVVDHDGGPFATALVDDALGGLEDAGVATVERIPEESAAIVTLEAGDAGAVIVIPAGFSAAVTGAAPTTIRVVGGQYPMSFEVARAAVSRFASDVGSVQLMVASAAGPGGVDAALVGAAAEALHGPSPLAVVRDAPAARQAGRATFYAAAMAIMFVFFATQYGALALHADRQAGTMTRLQAAPISARAILLGASFASLALGAVAMTVIAVATTLLVGADWGPPLLVAGLIGAGVVAATGISMVVATLARTPQQAGALNSMVALTLAALGGVFLPLSQAPETIVTLSAITPHAWFLRGVDMLADPGAGLPEIAPSLLVLVGMGLALGLIGLGRARRTLVAG
jgi:ABC-2 type transport system permease protein